MVESGEVTTPDGQVLNYPTLNYRKEVVEKDKVNSLVDSLAAASSRLDRLDLGSSSARHDRYETSNDVIGISRHDRYDSR